VNVIDDNIHLASLSAHKIYGPKGVGALYVRRRDPRVRLTAQMDGGGHERGMRSGTLNVPGIVGFGEACAICQREMADESARLARLRDKLKDRQHGTSPAPESEHEFCLRRRGVAADGHQRRGCLQRLSLYLGHPGASSIRFGLGRFNTEEEVDYVGDKVVAVVKKLRELSPLYEMAKEGVDVKRMEWDSR